MGGVKRAAVIITYPKGERGVAHSVGGDLCFPSLALIATDLARDRCADMERLSSTYAVNRAEGSFYGGKRLVPVVDLRHRFAAAR